MNEIILKFPQKEDNEAVMQYLQEHFNNQEFSLNGAGGLDRIKEFDKWLEKVQNGQLKEKLEEGRVPSTLYLAIRKEDGKIVGMIQVRHQLNEALLRYNGNIGYGVRPSERKKGYAKMMLELALNKCQELGIKQVLVSCDKDNVASRKTIISNGGKKENEIRENGIIVERYWINLEEK